MAKCPKSASLTDRAMLFPQRLGWICVCLLLAAIELVGCVSQPVNQPLQVMADRQESLRRRLAAAEQVGSPDRYADPQAAWLAYERIVFSDRQPEKLRLTLIDQMAAADVLRFWHIVDDKIVYVDHWPVMQHIFALAESQNYQPFVGTAVRSYARPSQRFDDADRPERQVIAALYPDQPVDETIWQVFTLENSKWRKRYDLSHQAAAWVLLQRLASQQAIRDELMQTQGPTPLVRDLQAAANVLDVLPATREQLLWLIALREDAEKWSHIEKRVTALTPAQRLGLALRHLATLLRATPAQLVMDRAQLAAQVDGRLRQVQIVPRTDPGGMVPRPPERFDEVRSRLVFADLLVLERIMETLGQPRVRQALLTQAEADRADEHSEYGGVLTFAQGPVTFTPELGGVDTRYVMPIEGIATLYNELAHYHFQVQEPDHAAYAGPGLGDLRFAQIFGCNAVVFTSVDADTLNADFYLGDGTIVDLGLRRR